MTDGNGNDVPSSVTLLKPKVGWIFILAMGTGAILGPWTLQMPFWFGITGASVPLAFIIGLIGITPVAFVYGELTSMLPFAGGEYNFIRSAFGREIGWLAGWLLVFTYTIAVAFMGPAVIRVLQILASQTDLSWPIVAASSIVLLLIFAVMNYFDVRISFGAQLGMAAVMVVVGLSLALAFSGSGHWTSAYLKPFMPAGMGGLLTAVGVLATMYTGFDTIPQMIEESTYSRAKQIRVMLGALWVAGILYIIISLANAGMAPASKLAEMLAIDPELAQSTWGNVPWTIALVVALLAILTTLNGFMLASSRLVFALGRSRVVTPGIRPVYKYCVTP